MNGLERELPISSQVVLAGTYEPVHIAYPEKVGSQEIGTFLSLPWKKNSSIDPTSRIISPTSKMLNTLSKAFISTPPVNNHRIEVPTEEELNKISFLDYREIFGNKFNDSVTIDMNDQKFNFLNNLRLHAGAPEKSDKGVEKLLK